jgi:hypothetical protein
MKRSKYGDFESKDGVLDYIVDLWELYDGEGMEEAYAAFMKLPVDRRTAEELDRICKGVFPADIDPYDDDELLPWAKV